MVQARILLAAIVLTVTVPPAQADISCATIKSLASGYTAVQLEQMADNYRLTESQKRHACACVYGKRSLQCRKK